MSTDARERPGSPGRRDPSSRRDSSPLRGPDRELALVFGFLRGESLAGEGAPPEAVDGNGVAAREVLFERP